jgi:hypothetical protein
MSRSGDDEALEGMVVVEAMAAAAVMSGLGVTSEQEVFILLGC